MNSQSKNINSQHQSEMKNINSVDNGPQSENDSQSGQDYKELLPQQDQVRKPRADKPIEYYSRPFVREQQEFQAYELLPRESEHRELRTDIPAAYGSRPFVYTVIEKHHKRQIQMEERQNDQNYGNKNSFERQDNKEMTLQERSLEFFHETKKNLNISSQDEAHKIEEQILQRDSQKQQQSDQSKSIVSKSSQRQQEPPKQTQLRAQAWSHIHQASIINKKEYYSSIAKAEQIKEVIMIKPQSVESVKKINQNAGESLNLIKVSPQSKGLQENELDVSFSPLYKEIEPTSDPYEKYKRSAESSPIKPNVIDVSIEKHTGYKRHMQQKQDQQMNPSPFQEQKRPLNFLHTPPKDLIFEQEQTSQQKLAKSMQEIDNLRKDLLKSTQSNINAIFNTNLSGEECYLAQMVEGVQKKMSELYQKMDRMEVNRVKEMEWEMERMKVSEREKQREREEREWERERDRELAKQRQRQEMVDRQKRYNGSNGNMILDLGKASDSSGKIIAIYPANNIASVKQLMFGHNQKQSKSYLQSSSMKMMLQLQQSFMKTLHQFQQQINISIDRRLSEVKAFQQSRGRAKSEALQKLQRVSQETNDREEEYDDSRGSINVIYLSKLRQLEQFVKDKDGIIQRLEKENSQLERQLQKWEHISFYDRETHGQVNRQVQRVQNEFPLSRELSFRKNPALDPKTHQSLASSVHQQQATFVSFSRHPINLSSPKSGSSSSQKQQQRIKQPVGLTTEQLNCLNPYSKKKNTHSFHHFESKNLQASEITELRQRLGHYELVLKEKDLRIRELQNTIMDQLESSRKWRVQKSLSGNSSKISGYESVKSSEDSPQLLHMKINNLKTLYKEAKKRADKFEKLYNDEKFVNMNVAVQHNVKTESKLGEDMVSNTSKSMCVSDKATVKNQRNVRLSEFGINSPFAFITERDETVLKSRQLTEQETSAIVQSYEADQNGIMRALVNFVMMAWSLRDVVSKLCGKEVNVEKINKNARQFLNELRGTNSKHFNSLCTKLQECSFVEMMKGIWLD